MANEQTAGTGAGTGAAAQGQPNQGATGAPDIPEDLQNIVVKGEDGNVMVPLDALKAERQKRQTAETGLTQARDQLLLYSMNPVAGGVQPAGQGPAQDPAQAAGPKAVEVPDWLEKLDDDEIIEAGELKKLVKGITGATGPQVNAMDDQTMGLLGEQLLSFVKPDSATMLAGKFAQRLQTEPWLRNFVMRYPPVVRPFIAYNLGQGKSIQEAVTGGTQDLQSIAPAGAQPGQTGGQPAVDEIVKNAGKPTPTSQITGAGALDSAKRFETMTDDEIEAKIERVKARA